MKMSPAKTAHGTSSRNGIAFCRNDGANVAVVISSSWDCASRSSDVDHEGGLASDRRAKFGPITVARPRRISTGFPASCFVV
jgi:hypothetical protein